jgi:hypothetical protein
VDVFREPWEEDTWVCRRDPSIRRPVTDAIERDPNGIPYLAPEIVLLFKAKHAARDKDAADFARVLPLLDVQRRQWLADALGVVHLGMTGSHSSSIAEPARAGWSRHTQDRRSRRRRWGSPAGGEPHRRNVLVSAGRLEVVLLHVVDDLLAEYGALHVRGSEVDAAPDAGVDDLLERD